MAHSRYHACARLQRGIHVQCQIGDCIAVVGNANRLRQRVTIGGNFLHGKAHNWRTHMQRYLSLIANDWLRICGIHIHNEGVQIGIGILGMDEQIYRLLTTGRQQQAGIPASAHKAQCQVSRRLNNRQCHFMGYSVGVGNHQGGALIIVFGHCYVVGMLAEDNTVIDSKGTHRALRCTAGNTALYIKLVGSIAR